MALLRFGVFELDADAGELRRQGRMVRLTGQPFKALQLLVSRPGDLVTREELRRHIWDDARFVDFDRSLNFCIAAVRDALGDSARNPRFIETIPRRGYRFIGDVRKDEDGSRTPKDGRWKPVFHHYAVAAVMLLLLLQGRPAPPPPHTRATAAPDALAAFEQGMADRRQPDDGWRRSLYRFREATRLDPRFAEAHYALADVYLDLADSRLLPPEAALAQARDAAERAVALEEVGETRTILGVVRLLQDWDWAGARREFVRSLAIEPNSDNTLVAYARFLSAAGEHPAAIATIDRAEALSPMCDLMYWESALVRYRAHRGADALAKAQLAIEYGPPGGVDPARWRSQVTWLRLLVHVDQQAWTLAAADAATIAEAEAGADAANSNTFAKIPDAGTRPAVLDFARRAADRAAAVTGASRRPVWTATLYAVAAEDEAALAWLERAVTERDPDVLFGLRNPAFDALRGRERFRRLMIETRLPDGRTAADPRRAGDTPATPTGPA
jgi:DNA-binding winged helix-turn-helix (wHTH) protein/tetratricopeptide (TPR) repeat protein